MARRDEITDRDVLAHLAGLRGPVSLREIARALELRHQARRALQKIIARLKHKGEIEEVHSGRYRLAGGASTGGPPKRSAGARPESAPSSRHGGHAATSAGRKPSPAPTHAAGTQALPQDSNLVTGRMVTHHDGYGFVVPDKPIPAMEGDLFIGRDNLGDAMHGDHVLARMERRSRAGLPGRAEGRVMRILERAHPTVVGLFRYGDRGTVVLPYDTRLLHEIVIPLGEELTPELRAKLGAQAAHGRRRARLPELDGAVVNVELTRFPRGGVAPAGRVVEIVGRPGEFGVDVEIIIRKQHLPYQFPGEVQAEAERAARPVAERDLAGREDFRHLPIVTIDGEMAKDFDDAVHVERLANGRWQLQVHIADVAHYVERASPLDREARLRGTSVYFPDRAVPMLPEALSNGICSLNPQVDRLVMSAVMEMDADGRVVNARFTPGVICSAERMTYTNVNKVLEGDPETTARYAVLEENFRRMSELALVLNSMRSLRGSIDFDLP
jgi:ribonuclease R